jgi:hypothetical protein
VGVADVGSRRETVERGRMLTCGAYVDDGDVVVRSAYSISSRLVGRLSRLRRHILEAPRKGYAVLDFSLTIYEVTARARVFVAALALPRWFDSNKRLSPLPSSSVASSVSSDAQAKKTFTGRIELAVDDAEDDGSTRKVGRDLGS